MIELLWIKRKYSKKSFGENVLPGSIVKILNGKIVLCQEGDGLEIVLGVYEGNGIVKTRGKTKIRLADK